MPRAIHHPNTDDIDLATVLRALGDPVRLMIVRLLADQGEQNCAALQSKLDMPRVDLLVPPAPAARGGRHADPRGRH